jgi:hypothetical protein
MYHDLPRTARFWSFLLAVDHETACVTASAQRSGPVLVVTSLKHVFYFDVYEDRSGKSWMATNAATARKHSTWS